MFFGSKKAKGKGKKAKAKAAESSGAYRRGRRPVSVRRGVLDWRAWPWRSVLAVAAVTALTLTCGLMLQGYMGSSERFRFDAEGLRIAGLENLDESAIQGVFELDFGRSLGSAPLADRRRELVAMPWVREAVVARQWPNRIWVDIRERRPVAFVRAPEGPGESLTLRLIDDEGELLEALDGRRWELPVVDGLTVLVPRAERERRLEIFERMIAALDREEPRFGARLSQVNLAEPDNIRITTVHEGDVIELQLGDELFRRRFEVFDRYIGSWKRKFGTVASVDLRFEDQVVVLPLRATAEATKRGGD